MASSLVTHFSVGIQTFHIECEEWIVPKAPLLIDFRTVRLPTVT